MPSSTTPSTSEKTRESSTTLAPPATSPLSSMSFAERAELEEREGNRAFLAEFDRLQPPPSGKHRDGPPRIPLTSSSKTEQESPGDS